MSEHVEDHTVSTSHRDDCRIGPASGGGVRQLIILCHGYGADSYQQIERARRISRALPDAVIVCPNGYSSVGADPTKRRWFPTKGVTQPPPPAEVRKAVQRFDATIDAERARYDGPPEGYALVGFSQGGSLVLASGLTRPDPPRALIAFAGLLPMWRREWSSISARPPTLIVNGQDDRVVPMVMARRTVDILRDAGVPVRSRWLPGVAHAVGASGSAAAIAFLREQFRPAS